MTVEKRISIEESQAHFVEDFARYGFTDANEMISKALELLQKELALEKELELSASLYAEVYQEDEETQAWTDSATLDWD